MPPDFSSTAKTPWTFYQPTGTLPMSSRPSLAPRPPSSIWLIEPESEMSRIPYPKPAITEREVACATDAARNGWGERGYEYINCRLGIAP